MRIAVARLKSASPYSQGNFIAEKKPRDRTHREHEELTWRQRMNVDENGVVIMPPMSFKLAICEAAKMKPTQIPGKGKATYTKNFVRGVMVFNHVSLGVKAEEVQGEWKLVPSDGKRGGTTRVEKCFPIIPSWEVDVTFHVLDDTLTEEVFETALSDAGRFIGVGRFRPENFGYYGRFSVESVKWSKE
jgi:hypothetical protein